MREGVGRGALIPSPSPESDGGRSTDTHLALAVFFLTALVGILVLVYTASRYSDLPERVPIHFGGSGRPDGWAQRSFASVFLLPLLNLALGPFTALMAYGTSTIRTAPPRAPERRAFARLLSRFLGTVALLSTGMLSVGSVGAIRVGLGEAERLPPLFLVLSLVLGGFVLGGAVYLVVLANRALGAARAGEPDGGKRRTGFFYYDRSDPSFFVEARHGWGYTLNFGNRIALGSLVGFLALVLFILVMAVSAAAGA